MPKTKSLLTTALFGNRKNKERKSKATVDFSVLEQVDEGAKVAELAGAVGNLNLGRDKENIAPALPAAPQYTNKPTDQDNWRTIPTKRQPLRPTNLAAQTASPWEAKDWRDPQLKKVQSVRYAASHNIRAARSNATGRMSYKPMGPCTPLSAVPHSNFRKGVIVWHWDIRAYYGKDTPETNPQIFVKKDGSKWKKKGRYWVIVHVTAKFVWEVPIYTNNNTGLAKTPRQLRKEYFSLLPMGVAIEGSENQSPGNKVVAIDWLELKDGQLSGRPMRRTMVAHATEVMCRDIDAEPVRIVGAIADEDIAVVVGKAAPGIRL